MPRSTKIGSTFLICFAATLVASGGETDDNALGLHSDGKQWGFRPTPDEQFDANRPSVLLIGDSILGGYLQPVRNKLSGRANIDYWKTPDHLNSKGLRDRLKQAVSHRPYDVVHFNIGLHGWSEGRIPEGKYAELLSQYVETIKQHAPAAKLVWASTTPVHEQDGHDFHPEINPTIVERNALALEVMDHWEVQVNDLYGIMSENMELVRGDRFHWQGKAYPMMATQIVDALALEELHRP